METNYMYYQDKKTGKVFVVSFCYTRYKTGYAFAIQSLEDAFCKRTGRELAISRFKYGLLINAHSSATESWQAVKNHFNLIRSAARYWCSPVDDRVLALHRFPSHIGNATLLPTPTERKNQLP